MNVLVVGGSSGLGLELAKSFSNENAEVTITGRQDPQESSLNFIEFDLAPPELPKRIGELTMRLPEINTLVYAAGYYQEGRVDDLSEDQIEEMLNVCGRGLIYFTRAILEKQKKLDELIVITSSSAWTPRKLEPIYNYVKAGEGHFANAMAEDGRVGKVLVDGQFGMQTKFWRDKKHPDWDKMLKPEWVAEQIMDARKEDYKYKFIRIHRDPPKVEVVEKR